MQLSLRTPAVRDAYLAALAATGFHNRAAQAAGISTSAVNQYRAKHPDFAAACTAALAAHDAPPPQTYTRWTPRRRADFLAAFAAGGNATAACAAAGVTLSGAFALRQRDADFAADWAIAKQEAAQRLQDRLMDGALNGFTATETVGGVTRTRVWQAPATMLRLAGEFAAALPRYRMIELSPGLVADARDKVERRIAREVAEQVAAREKATA